jgi:hypothetical protein
MSERDKAREESRKVQDKLLGQLAELTVAQSRKQSAGFDLTQWQKRYEDEGGKAVIDLVQSQISEHEGALSSTLKGEIEKIRREHADSMAQLNDMLDSQDPEYQARKDEVDGLIENGVATNKRHALKILRHLKPVSQPERPPAPGSTGGLPGSHDDESGDLSETEAEAIETMAGGKKMTAEERKAIAARVKARRK